jgi:hypothetical protein
MTEAGDPSVATEHAFALYLHEPMLHGLLAGPHAPGPRADRSWGDPAHQALFHLLDSATTAGTLGRVGSAGDLASLAPGDLVQVVGMAQGNPLIRVMDFVAAMMPLVDEPAEPVRVRPGRTTAAALHGDPETEAAQRVLAGVVAVSAAGLRSHPLVDVVMTSGGGMPVVLTLDRGILGAAGEALLAGLSIRVVGKVASVISPDRPLNLFRHSVLAATSAEASRDMLAELSEGGLDLESADPVVTGPGLEILALAVLI